MYKLLYATTLIDRIKCVFKKRVSLSLSHTATLCIIIIVARDIVGAEQTMVT